jgi:hypothetical protein
MIFCLTITLFQNNMLNCSEDFKLTKLGMGNSYVKGGGGSQTVQVHSRVVDLLYRKEKNVRVSSFKLKHI